MKIYYTALGRVVLTPTCHDWPTQAGDVGAYGDKSFTLVQPIAASPSPATLAWSDGQPRPWPQQQSAVAGQQQHRETGQQQSGRVDDTCGAALFKLCGPTINVSVAACKACVVKFITELGNAGCTPEEEVGFCARAPPPSPPPPPPPRLFKCEEGRCVADSTGWRGQSHSSAHSSRTRDD